MRKQAIIVAFAFAIAGCSRTPFPVIEAKLDELKGQPIKSVIDKLGSPTEQNQVGNEKTYVWNLTSNIGVVYQTVGLGCVIKVFADKDDNVIRYTYDGNVGGCGQYAHKLDDGYHTAQGILD
jgi:hypothetical protein